LGSGFRRLKGMGRFDFNALVKYEIAVGLHEL
jgi:hypothetical protein